MRLTTLGLSFSLVGFWLCMSAAMLDGPDWVFQLGIGCALVGVVLSLAYLLGNLARTHFRAKHVAGDTKKSNVCLNFGCCPGDVSGTR